MIDQDSVYSDTVRILAPAELVWQILIDFDHYGQWNSFCPEISAELRMGAAVNMMTDLGNGLQKQVEYITRIEPGYAIAWSMENNPGDPIHACRTQFINPVSESSCLYSSIDEFSGDAMPDMLASFGQHVETGFNNCARDLKRYAEQRFRETG